MKVIVVRTPSNGNMESHLVISCSQEKLPVVELGGIQLSFWSWGSCGGLKTKQPQLMLVGQKLILHKLPMGLHCWGQHPHRSLGMGSLGWCLHSYVPMLSHIINVGINPCRLPKKKKKETWTPTQPQNLWLTICTACKMCLDSGIT